MDPLIKTDIVPEGKYFDAWSIPHAGFGCMVACLMPGRGILAPMVIAGALASLYEIAEPYIWKITPWHETPENQVADVLLSIAGAGIYAACAPKIHPVKLQLVIWGSFIAAAVVLAFAAAPSARQHTEI